MAVCLHLIVVTEELNGKPMFIQYDLKTSGLPWSDKMGISLLIQAQQKVSVCLEIISLEAISFSEKQNPHKEAYT